jgi:hypothetical protein
MEYMFLFEKMICFSWFGKISISNVSLFSTTNLVVVNSIRSQSTFYNANTKCIHKINLNNLNEHFLCFKRSCQVEYVSFYDISIIAKGENNNEVGWFIYWSIIDKHCIFVTINDNFFNMHDEVSKWKFFHLLGMY